MKVKELKKILKNVPDHLDVYTADHDHCEYETNGLVNLAEIRDQKDLSDCLKKQLKNEPVFRIKGPYFVIRV